MVKNETIQALKPLVVNATVAKKRSFKDIFEARAFKAIFHGFSLGQKGWKVLDLESEEVIVSRDVQFQETVFPYADKILSHPPTSVNDKSARSSQANTDDEGRKFYSRSNRKVKKPTWLSEYVVNADILTITHLAFLSKVHFVKEPKNYQEVAKDDRWVNAMKA